MMFQETYKLMDKYFCTIVLDIRVDESVLQVKYLIVLHLVFKYNVSMRSPGESMSGP